MKKVFFTFLFISSMFLLNAQSKNGWRDLKWGDSREVVSKKYKIEEVVPNSSASISNFELAGQQFKVDFYFNDSNKLYKVVVRNNSPENLISLTQELEKNLIEK